jgi:positive regulator of sigma E activity
MSVVFQGSIVENNGALELRGHFRSNLFFKIFAIFSLLVILFQADFIAENLLTLVALLGMVFGFEAYLQYLKKGLTQKINDIFI